MLKNNSNNNKKGDFSQQELLTFNNLSVCLNLNLYFPFIHLILYYIQLFCHVPLK